MNQLAALWAEERDGGFARLTGSSLRAVVPVREQLAALLLNHVRLPSAVRGLAVRFLTANHIGVEAEIQVLGFRKRLETVLRIEGPMRAERPRTMRLAFAERSFLTSAASLAGSVLGGEGLEVRDGTITVDVDRLASRAGVADLAEHLRTLAISTDEGVLWIEVEAKVDGPSRNRPPVRVQSRADEGGAFAPPATHPPQDLGALLEGTHADVVVRATESLVNAAVRRIVAAVGTRADGESEERGAGQVSRPLDWRTLLLSLPAPKIRFEAGAMVVEAEFAIGPRSSARA
ncbi:MAG TPA: hypothetical protein VNK41_10495 [Vicinamibacterales bacterium]|nr:hypothetical protein [Vicinamibacterales bacterium]